jgi:uncharacterized protein (TIGR02271 family)
MAYTVIGVFDNRSEAQQAVQQLTSSGFSHQDIDISSQRTDTASDASYRRDDDTDSIGSFFRSLFGSDDEATTYSEVARRGVVVTVHAQSGEQSARAVQIMDQYGAVDVDDRARHYRREEGTLTSQTSATDTDKAIPIIEEQLQVGKREVETGGVRVRSRVLERPVEEHLRLREEHVHVERNPVNRPATEADLSTFKEGEIEITEHAEVPAVNKEARVVEEVRLSKEVEEREETVRDTIRKTDVDVEKLDRDIDLDRDTDLDRTDDRRAL